MPLFNPPSVTVAQISNATTAGRNFLTATPLGTDSAFYLTTGGTLAQFGPADWVANFLNGGFPAASDGTQTPVTSITTNNGIVSAKS